MRDELARRLESVRHHVTEEWTAERIAASFERFERRRRRRRAVTRAGVGAGLVAVVVAAAAVVSGPGPFGPSPRSIASSPRGAAVRSSSTLHFDDGSTATALSEDSRLVATRVSSTDVRVRLDRGAARFDVASRPERLFRVDAGDVTVMVLGTAFSVRRHGARSEVEIDHGRVRVAWPRGAQVLTDGQRGVFPPVEDVDRAAPAVEAPEGSDRGATPPRGPALESRRASSHGWRSLAEDGRYDEAYAALERAGGVVTLRGLADALLAADVMRRSGRPAEAADVLASAIERHPSDPRAAVASFTLGRVLLNQVGRPRQAADAFARARRLAPTGALAEDALAREVEALSRAGALPLARRRAREYLERYPTGRRRGAVRRFGELE